MKKHAISLTVIAASIICLSFLSDKPAIYCGRKYIEQRGNVYLKDENINTVMVNVLDNKTKKFVFGYIVSAIRNDTNFIYTRFHYVGDTIIRKEYHDYNISRGKDSIISKFVCNNKGIYFYSYQRYLNGKIITVEYPNRMLGK